MPPSNRYLIAILIIGASGIIAQILLLRELLIIFQGNELSIGVILANWLILEAIGAFFIGKSIERIRAKEEVFILLTLLFSIFLPIMVCLVRIWKGIIGVLPGEGLGMLPIFYSSFIIFLPVSIPHGALFTFGCKIYALYSKHAATDIGKVYIWETIGTIIGGIIFTYFFVIYFSSLQVALLIALLHIIICVFLLRPTYTISRKFLQITSIILAAICIYLLFTNKATQIHYFSIKKQWKGQNVVHYQNSIYGNVVVVKRAEQYTFFFDGIPIITTPTPDIIGVEEFVHLSLLFHPNPKEVLIISGGAGGVINEVLKHPVEKVDYVELDPLLLKVIKKFSTPLTKNELSDKRVDIHHTDGRLFLKKTTRKYDLILLGLSNPQDLQINRFFSYEYFSLTRNKLKKNGIVAISLPGSLTYLPQELKNLNGCILSTLKCVFPHIRIIPGEEVNIFLASSSNEISLIKPTHLIERLKERKLKVSLLTPFHIEYKLHQRWLNWFLTSLKGSTTEVNYDLKPIGLFYSLSYWNALFSPYMQKVFRWAEKVNIKVIATSLGIFLFFFVLLNLKIRTFSGMSIPFAILSTGFAGMMFDLVLIFTFQALYGFVFYWISILVTAFMTGVAVGSLVMTYSLEKIKKDIRYFLTIEAAIIIFSCLLPLIFIKLSHYLEKPIIFLLLQIVFLIISFIGGTLIGAQFPLASKIKLKTSTNLSKTAGLLYGCDLFGGWIGGIIGGVILLPILGLLNSCLIVVMLKVSSLLIVAISVR